MFTKLIFAVSQKFGSHLKPHGQGAPFGEQAAYKSACSEEETFIKQHFLGENARKTAGSR